MRYIFLLIIFFIAAPSYAQNQPAWKWAKSDTSAQISINPSYIKEAIGVGNNRVLWGYLKNKKTNFGAAYGDNLFAEYDTLGTLMASAMVTGNVSLTQIEADSAGNWYVLADVFDTIRFSATQVYTTNVMANDSKYFLFKLHRGTLALDWCQKLAANYLTTVDLIAVQHNKLYMVTDSGLVSQVVTVDMTNGNRTQVLTQQGNSRISSLQADDRGNIYIAGGCASSFTGLNFNGTQAIPTNPNFYPSYIVRYKSNGQHDWHIWMTDNTCVARKLTLVTNNFIYYSGAVHDTMRLGAYQLHKPAWVSSFMVSRLDSAGNVVWVNQLKDTVGGDGSLEHTSHAVASADSSITVFANVRGNINPGSGLVATSSIYGQAMCIHYRADGIPLWTKQVGGQSTIAQQIAANATDVWVTGAGRDSFSYKFDAITVPAGLVYPPYMARLYTGAKVYNPQPSSVGNAGGNILISVKPNPASNTITISGLDAMKNNALLTLTDMIGRTVYQKTIARGSSDIEIDVAGYARGVYVLQVKGEGTQYVRRLLLR